MELIWPMLTMIGLSLAVMPLTVLPRILAIRKKEIHISQMKCMNIQEMPEHIQRTTRHWSNLYEVPTLFYALMLLCLIFHWQDQVILTSAWIYVCLRILHTTIHITYNKVFHRFLAFMTSNIFLTIIFVRIVLIASR